MAPILRDLIQTPNFRVVVVEDCEAVEVCGALKVRNVYTYISSIINETISFLICAYLILLFSISKYVLCFRILWHAPLVS